MESRDRNAGLNWARCSMLTFFKQRDSTCWPSIATIGCRLLHKSPKTTFTFREVAVGVEKFIVESPKVTLRTACRCFYGPTQQFVAEPGVQVFR